MPQTKEIKPIHLTNNRAIKLIQERAKRELRSLSNSLTATIIEHLGQNNTDELIEKADNRQG